MQYYDVVVAAVYTAAMVFDFFVVYISILFEDFIAHSFLALSSSLSMYSVVRTMWPLKETKMMNKNENASQST